MSQPLNRIMYNRLIAAANTIIEVYNLRPHYKQVAHSAIEKIVLSHELSQNTGKLLVDMLSALIQANEEPTMFIVIIDLSVKGKIIKRSRFLLDKRNQIRFFNNVGQAERYAIYYLREQNLEHLKWKVYNASHFINKLMGRIG
jgi:hypothetical protein